MNATMAASGAKAVPPVVSSVQDIPLENIRESNSNPRRVFDETQLRELAANIQLHGVLQAILVRPSQDGANGVYELVAGARRFRASKLAGKRTIPATVRNLTDAEAQEIRLIENLQRTNIHELDEGIGYRSLMDLRPDFYTVETIAAQVAKSPSYVKGRISLTLLIPAAQAAFYDGKLSVAHGLEIARLQPRDQEKALMECFPGHRSTGSILKDRKAEAVTVRQLRQWIEREIHLDLKNAPFDTEDANLLPSAGACSTCPKRTGNNPLLFPEIKKSSSTAAKRGQSFTFAQTKSARPIANSLTTKSRRRRENSAESLRLRSGSRRKHVRAFWWLFDKSSRLHWRARTSRWLRWITSAALVMTIITDCSRCTAGKRRRRRHRGVGIPWITKGWRKHKSAQ